MSESKTTSTNWVDRVRQHVDARESADAKPSHGDAATKRLSQSHASPSESPKSSAGDSTHDLDFGHADHAHSGRLGGLLGAWGDDNHHQDSSAPVVKSESEPPKSEPPKQPRSPGEVAKILENNLSRLDTAAGGGIIDRIGQHLGLGTDGVFGVQDLQKVAEDPSAPQDLREAAQQVLDDPNLYHSIDAANGSNLDNRISAGDLERVQQDQAKSGNKASILDMAHRLDGKESGQERSNFDIFDSIKTGGKTDGKISRDDLQAASKDSALTQSQRDLAQQFLDDPTYWDAFDLGAKSGSKDGVVSRDDLTNVLYAPSARGGSDQWSSGKDQALDRALHDPNISTSDLFKGFSQTDRGNCVSTAIIKGAIDHYGSKIFDSVEKNDKGGYTVRLQDGNTVSVSADELSLAAAGAHYNANNDETGAYANLAYAVMAKRAQEMDHEGSRTYSEALVSLANGENPHDTPAFLGLENKVKGVDIKDVQGKDGVVAWGHGHCIYVDTISGKTYGDAWGDQRGYDGTNYTGDKKDGDTLTDAFIFT